MESSVRISKSIKEILKTYPVKIDIDISKLEESLDETNINISKPSEMANFILGNTENAKPLAAEETEIIDSQLAANDENEIVEAQGVKVFEKNAELLIPYMILIVTIIVSLSNFFAGILFSKAFDEFFDPAFKHIHKKTNNLDDMNDNHSDNVDNNK